MNVASVSGLAGNSQSNSTNDTTQLERQLAAAQKELQDLNQSKENEKTKQQKISLIQLKIQQIESKISMKKSQNTQNFFSENSSETAAQKSSENNPYSRIKKASTSNRIDTKI